MAGAVRLPTEAGAMARLPPRSTLAVPVGQRARAASRRGAAARPASSGEASAADGFISWRFPEAKRRTAARRERGPHVRAAGVGPRELRGPDASMSPRRRALEGEGRHSSSRVRRHLKPSNG